MDESTLLPPTLPTGTITFLFSDIEGSTKLWEARPEAMRMSVARHDALLRQAVQEHDGYLFKTTGDGIAAAFATAARGVAAALSAQQALKAEPWPEYIVIRSRMGLHTGAAEWRDGDYFGPTLNRAARLMAAGHGGQTLLSEVTHELTRDSLPPGVSLKPLGVYRLKDLARPETVYQLAHPLLMTAFPPLRTLDLTPNNLPQQVTSFVGREKPLAEVASLLSKTRLLTLTGSGGSGKTRLSLQAAADALDQYPDGVWLVELAALSDPSLVPQTVAIAFGVREQAGQSLLQTLTESLKPRRLLLVLDNCEHVLQACAAIVAGLIRACPQVRVIATSREALGIAGETTYRVPTLTLPSASQARAATPDSLSQYEAVRLFIERAQAIKPDFVVANGNAPALAQLCYRLDGIPLAIELAAARVRSLAVEQINDRLDSRFRLLTGGDRAALPRQQTLRALIDWSYDLLTENEKTLLARLSVFAGGWTLEAAEAVCGWDTIEDWEVLELLTSLADKSLILAEEAAEAGCGGATRYRMLETVRQYAAERVAPSGESDAVLARSREFFVALAESAQAQLSGPEQVTWMNRLETEHDNLRATLDACAAKSVDSAEAALAGLRLSGALWRFWWVRGYLSEGREQLTRALAARPFVSSSSATGDVLLAQKATAAALRAGGVLAWSQGDYATAQSLFTVTLSLYREIEEQSGIARTLLNLAAVAFSLNDHAAARALYEESLSLYRAIADRGGIASAMGNLGNVALGQGDFEAARSLYEESLTLYREIGDKGGIARMLANLGNITLSQDDYILARSLFEESLSHYRETGDRSGIAYGLAGMASACIGENDARRAAVLWAAAGAWRESIGAPLLPADQAIHDAEIEKARSEMGEDAFTAAWEEGRAMTWEQAVELALG